MRPERAKNRINNWDSLSAIRYAKDCNNDCIWEMVMSIPSVQVYLRNLSSYAAISFAIDINDLRIWKNVLARLDISIETAVEYSRIFNDKELSEIVNNRADFNHF